MSPQQRFCEYLIARGQRITEQSLAVVSEICTLNQSFTFEDLFAALKAKEFPVSRATVLRTLNKLEDAKIVSQHGLFEPIYSLTCSEEK